MNDQVERALQGVEQLVSGARAGSTAAFKELYELYSPRLFRRILALTKNREDAEDALQDTFMRAFLALPTFEGRSTFYSWVTRIAINSSLMVIRRRRTRPEVSFDSSHESGVNFTKFEHADPGPNPEQLYEQNQTWVTMQRAIDWLEPNLRSALQLQVRHGSSINEIARKLDVSVSATKSRLHRARRRLRERAPLKRNKIVMSIAA